MSTQRTIEPGWPYEESPFHEGELALQERFGRRERLDIGIRRGMRTVLIDQHRTFFSQLPLVLLGGVDASGQPWATMLTGKPGFTSSPDPQRLHIAALPANADPLSNAIKVGAKVGVLGIELHTRRRNRMSGTIESVSADGFTISVAQSYGNCPQYIQSRELLYKEVLTPVAQAKSSSDAVRLSESDKALLSRADTFFIASAYAGLEDRLSSGTDVSHRGGRAGFISVDDDKTITTPDFAGNYFFNTLGNLQTDPRAGVLFVDFECGDLLFVAAHSEVQWEGPEVEAFKGAKRLLRFHITRIVRLNAVLPFTWSAPDYARQTINTGTWLEAEQIQRPE